MNKKSDDRKTVVVVGAGAAGTIIARTLSKTNVNVVVINPRSYQIINPATARLIVSERDALETKAFVPLDRLFINGNGTFVQGKVTSIDTKQNTILVDNGEHYQYDALVLATGSSWDLPLGFPSDEDQVQPFIDARRKEFKDAKHVVIAGAGAVGLELSGEIKDIWPDKKVTIIQGDNLVLNKAYPDRFRRKVQRGVELLEINMILNDYLDDIPEHGTIGVQTRRGITIEDADLVLSTRGPRPNTQFISTSLGAGSLSNSGYVKVEPTLQLQGYPNIFAAGDIIDYPEQKQAIKAGAHASVVSKNVINLLQNRSLVKYTGFNEMILITHGRNGGAAYFYLFWGWGFVFGNRFARMLKSRDLFLPRVRSMIGY